MEVPTDELKRCDEHGNPIWVPVTLKHLEQYFISRHTIDGKDVLIRKNDSIRVFRVKDQKIAVYILGKQRCIAVSVLRKLHFELPELIPYVDFDTQNPYQAVFSYLKSLVNDKGLPLWAEVRNFPDYMIHRNGTTIACKDRDLIRTPKEVDFGYFVVWLRKDKRSYHQLVHRMVWEAFSGQDIPSNRTIDHINRNPSDNRLENLRLATKREQTLNKRKRREESSYDWEVEVYDLARSMWVTFPNKREVIKHFNIPTKALEDILRQKKLSVCNQSFSARYKSIEERKDENGEPEAWMSMHGTQYFVSNVPEHIDPTTKKRSGARFSKITASGVRVKVNFIMKPNGYMQFGDARQLHRVVYEAFHGPIVHGHDIDHIDSDPTNNFIENLQSISRSDHVLKTHGKRVLVRGEVYPSIKDAAKLLNMTASKLGWRLKHGKDTDIYRFADEDEPATKRLKKC